MATAPGRALLRWGGHDDHVPVPTRNLRETSWEVLITKQKGNPFASGLEAAVKGWGAGVLRAKLDQIMKQPLHELIRRLEYAVRNFNPVYQELIRYRFDLWLKRLNELWIKSHS